jgi:Immunoglobulin-like domain of bacterial spore germination
LILLEPTKIHRRFIAGCYGGRVVRQRWELRRLPRKVRRENVARDIDEDSGRPFIKINHPAPGDVVRNPAHVAGYGTAFEGTISLRIRDDDGTVIAQESTQGGSNGVIGEFKANLQFDRRPNQRLGVVEAFEESASGSGEDLHLFRVPIVFE